MKGSDRRYNLVFAIIIGAFGTYLYGMTVSGQVPFLLEALPGGNLGLFRQATEEQIIAVPLGQTATDVDIVETGTYRIISVDADLFASNLTIYLKATGQKVPVTVADLTTYAPYETELLQGRVLLDFQVSEVGTYQIEINGFDLNEREPIITLFPEYTAQNRQRILIGGGILLVALVGVWYWFGRSSVPKARREEKRGKWDDFVKQSGEKQD